jgi:hypothetical protein
MLSNKTLNKFKKVLKTILLAPVMPVLMASGDNVENEVKFANTIVTVDSEVVSKVTSFNKKTSVSEENITGSEDVVPGTDVLHEVFTSIAVNETADVEGISIESEENGPDDGQSELQDAVDEGKIVTLTSTKSTGYGWTLSGFFTSYEEGADTSGVYKWKATFRINSKIQITPGS